MVSRGTHPNFPSKPHQYLRLAEKTLRFLTWTLCSYQLLVSSLKDFFFLSTIPIKLTREAMPKWQWMFQLVSLKLVPEARTAVSHQGLLFLFLLGIFSFVIGCFRFLLKMTVPPIVESLPFVLSNWSHLFSSRSLEEKACVCGEMKMNYVLK